MRICRFSHDGDVSFGLVEGPGDDPADLVVHAMAGHPFAPMQPTGAQYPLSAVRLLAPVLPSKVVCIGKNYADHVAEMAAVTGGETPATPVTFLKPSTSVVGPGDAIVLPRDSERVDHEAELGVVIGRLCREVPRARFADVVLGYTVGNDVTARDHQKADGQWTRGKGHDTFCPLGPWVETELDPRDLRVTCTVDGQHRQDGRTSALLHDVGAIVEWVSAFMTLLPGDVILTGTPAGVGPLSAGQSVSCTIEGIGTLTSPVVSR